jgi:ATP synthase protein I
MYPKDFLVPMDEKTDRQASSADLSPMPVDAQLSERLHALDRELEELRPPPEIDRSETMAIARTGMTMALRVSAEFAAGVIAGAAIGWGVDKLFKTSPWGLIVFVILGFAAGVLTVLRSVGVVKPGRDGGDDFSGD